MVAKRTELALPKEVRGPHVRWMEAPRLVHLFQQDFPLQGREGEEGEEGEVGAGEVRWVPVRRPWTSSEAKDGPYSDVGWEKLPTPLVRLLVFHPDVGPSYPMPLDLRLVEVLLEVVRNLGRASGFFRAFVDTEQGNLRPESDSPALDSEERRQFQKKIKGLLELPLENLIAEAIENTNLRDSKNKEHFDKVVAWIVALFSVAVALETEGTRTPWREKLGEILSLLSLVDGKERRNEVVNSILEAFNHVRAARSPFGTIEDVERFIRRLCAALKPLAELGEERAQLRGIPPFPDVGREVLRPFFLLKTYLDAALELVPWANRESSSEEAPLTRALNSEETLALIRLVILSMGWNDEEFPYIFAKWVLKKPSPQELPNLALLQEDARNFVKRLAVAVLGVMLVLGEEGVERLIEILNTHGGLEYNCPAESVAYFSRGSPCRKGVETYKEHVSALVSDLFRRFPPPEGVDISDRDWRRAVVIALWMEGVLEGLLEKALRGDKDLKYLLPPAVEQRVTAMALWAYNHRDELPLVV